MFIYLLVGSFDTLYSLRFPGIRLTESQFRIPNELKECYVNNNIQDFHLPLNIRVLLDIIRKAEKYFYTTMDMRTMSSSLMHRYVQIFNI